MNVRHSVGAAPPFQNLLNAPPTHHTRAPTHPQVTIQSSSLETLTAVADNPGRWLFHCHLNDHMDGGMLALFNVAGEKPQTALGGKVKINGQPLVGRHDLQDGDVVEVSGLTLEFRQKSNRTP